MRSSSRKVLCLVGAASLLASSAVAQEGEPENGSAWSSIGQALRDGRYWLNFRLRNEYVDQDGLDAANALTLRTNFGFESAAWHGASVLVEFQDVTPFGAENYNSTTNGKTNYAVIADPNVTEVNQAFLQYAGVEHLRARVGRQTILHDSGRFIGSVAFRQNNQTYDAFELRGADGEAYDVSYTYVENANRVTGDDNPTGDARMESHWVRGSCDVGDWGELVAYAYLLDYDTLDTSSCDTYGLRFKGSRDLGGFGLGYTLEAATQEDAGNNPNDRDQDYTLLELSGTMGGTTLLVAQETLGGSGDPGDAYQTPLATLHAFNGWADLFLTTPDTGLVDLYVGGTQKLGDDANLRLVWHSFEADSGGSDYGSEIDASLGWKLDEDTSLGVAYAAYDADTFAVDTTKAWVWLSYAP